MHSLTKFQQRKHVVSVVSMPYCIRNRFKNNWPKWQVNEMLSKQKAEEEKKLLLKIRINRNKMQIEIIKNIFKYLYNYINVLYICYPQ